MGVRVMMAALFAAPYLDWNALGAAELVVAEDPATGGICELKIAGDTTGMNWVRRADGAEFKWIGPEYMWGTGTVKADGRSLAWTTPIAVKDGIATYRLAEGLELVRVRRNDGGSVYERYALRNTGAKPVKLSEIDIHTPFRDDYLPVSELQTRRCHAHVWPGGSSAWVCAMRMGGAAPHLGLAVVEGRVTGYELKERGMKKGLSNTRGVIALSMPDVTLEPGCETSVAWRIFAHSGKANFLAKARRCGSVTASAADWTVDAKTPVDVTFQAAEPRELDGATVVGEGVKILATRREGPRLVATCAYEKDGEARVVCRYGKNCETYAELLARGDPAALVKARADFIVRHQVYRATAADDPRDGALVEFDNETDEQYRRWEHPADSRLEVDHNEGAERLAMGVFLARMAAAGHRAYLPTVKRYAKFVREGLQDPDYTTWGEVDRQSRKRLFNYPWVAEFQLAAYRATGEKRHLLDAFGTMMRLFAQLDTLVVVESPEVELVRTLRAAGCEREATALLQAMRDHKDRILAKESVFEEVNFAPEGIASQLTQFLGLWQLTGEEKYRRYALDKALPMFEACLGPQPSWHSHDIGMHHWDGFWFGKRKCWGDTLPHDWNGTGADALMLLAEATDDASYRVRARAVVRQLLGLFDADGRAGCAWVLPDRVNGSPAHFRDPLANDQDWALVFYLRVMDRLSGLAAASQEGECAQVRKEMRFKKVFAFSDIGDDAFAAKLAELNVFAAGCGGKPGSKEHAEQLAWAKRFGIVPYVSNCGPGAKAPHRQTLSPEEAYRQCELAGEFLPEDLKGASRGEALNALWRKQHYRWGGEPENGNFEVYFEGMGGCFVGPKARAAGADEIVRRLKAEPEAKAVCLDYIGYGNYHGCYHPHCLHLLKTWLGEKGLADTQANRDRFFEDELVAYYDALYDAVKAHDASVVVYAHLYPVFKPNPLFGNRLKLDYCGQTCAWYSRWPAEKVKKYAETVVRGQHDHWPFAHAAPFIAYGPWAGEIDPDFKKTPEDVERELRTFLEAGAEYLAVHEIKSVIDDPAVFAVFMKYCGKPGWRDCAVAVSDTNRFTCGSGPSSTFLADRRIAYVPYLASETGRGECHDIAALAEVPVDSPEESRSYVLCRVGETFCGQTVSSVLSFVSFPWKGRVRVTLDINYGVCGWRDWDPTTHRVVGEGLYKCRFGKGAPVEVVTPDSLTRYLDLKGMKGHDVLRERGDRLINGARPHWENGAFYGVLTSSWSQPIVYRCDDGETFEFLGVIPTIAEYECQLAKLDGRFYALMRGAAEDNFWVSDDGGATFRPCGRLPDGKQRPQLFVYGQDLLVAYSAPDEKPSVVRNGRNNLHILLGRGDDLSAYREVLHEIDPLGIVYYDFIVDGEQLYILWSNASRFPTYVKWGAVQGKDLVLFSRMFDIISN